MTMDVTSSIIVSFGVVISSYFVTSYLKFRSQLDADTKIEVQRMRSNADLGSARAEAGAWNYGQQDTGNDLSSIMGLLSNPALQPLIQKFLTKKE